MGIMRRKSRRGQVALGEKDKEERDKKGGGRRKRGEPEGGRGGRHRGARGGEQGSGSRRVLPGGGTDGRNSPGEDEFRSKKKVTAEPGADADLKRDFFTRRVGGRRIIASERRRKLANCEASQDLNDGENPSSAASVVTAATPEVVCSSDIRGRHRAVQRGREEERERGREEERKRGSRDPSSPVSSDKMKTEEE
ncbi:unnamed protein product [Pleuronectes platessa]|uniref:Uncharacterized protein n=1 Tax=Pleuronectes platessa TaxID=8262 RepID=A0A9N7YEC9_PLEPL|nr:unnamed protein product [Pleuronectes platessa]